VIREIKVYQINSDYQILEVMGIQDFEKPKNIFITDDGYYLELGKDAFTNKISAIRKLRENLREKIHAMEKRIDLLLYEELDYKHVGATCD